LNSHIGAITRNQKLKRQNSKSKSEIPNPQSPIANNPVLFVGAGPGDPELITIKGQKALMEADLVIYAGSLVPEALLQWARSDIRILSSASMHLEEIIAEIQSAHSDGQRVVRLHTGDPSLYGAIYEQMSELSKQGIPYKVIPGVTAAFAAAAALAIEYTLPEVSQTLILTRMAGRTPVPEKENLASLAKHQTSMAIYLSMSAIDEVSETLCDAYGENSTCAVVYRASQPQQKIILTPLKELAARVAAEKITKHALIIVSKVLAIDPDDIRHKSKLYDKEFKHECRS
jgi:precorrin-4/cobalt-precorrin-4 C11-methyltransferase